MLFRSQKRSGAAPLGRNLREVDLVVHVAHVDIHKKAQEEHQKMLSCAFSIQDFCYIFQYFVGLLLE